MAKYRHWTLFTAKIYSNKTKEIISREQQYAVLNGHIAQTNITLLSMLFGSCESGTYEDSWLIARILAKVHKKELEPPRTGTAEYYQLRGAGVFENVFESILYAMDGHEVCLYVYFL